MIKSLIFLVCIFFQSNLLAEWVPIKYESNKYDFFFVKSINPDDPVNPEGKQYLIY